MWNLQLAELHDRQYLETKFQENLRLSTVVSWGVVVLAVGLWVLDWSIDKVHASDTVGLRFLMGAVVCIYPLIVYLKLRRDLFVIVMTIAALAAQFIFSEILSRLDNGIDHGLGGYLYFFLSFTLVSLVMSIRASTITLVLLALAPAVTAVLLGVPAGLSLVRYAAFAIPAMAIVIFTCYVIDIFTYRNYATRGAMKELSETDELTGCKNRRHLFENGNQLLALAKRNGRPFCVLTLDLDYFKKINDTYGHPAGDAALRHASVVFAKEMRASDSLGRVGGEEFVALLPDTDLASATLVAERMVAVLAQTPVEWPQAPGGHIPMTVSIGVAGLDVVDHGDSLEMLLSRSDQALYEAKASGRDKATVWNDRLLGASKHRRATDERMPSVRRT